MKIHVVPLCGSSGKRQVWRTPIISEKPTGSPTNFRLSLAPRRTGSRNFVAQRQKWFALRFTGSDDEIDPLTSRNGQPPEFDQWLWERLELVAHLVVAFRREVYG